MLSRDGRSRVSWWRLGVWNINQVSGPDPCYRTFSVVYSMHVILVQRHGSYAELMYRAHERRKYLRVGLVTAVFPP